MAKFSWPDWARRLAAQEQIATDRMINQWVSQARPGDEIPPALAERLGLDQKRAVESLVSQADDAKTDPTVFQEILTGLRSRNPEETSEVGAGAALQRACSPFDAGLRQARGAAAGA